MACQKNIEQQKKSLIQVDVDFSNYSKIHGWHQAFLEFMDTNVVILKDNSMPVIGKQTMIELYKQSSDSGVTLEWKPINADIAKSSELGYTYGVWNLTQDTNVYQGTYVTIWKKDKTGKWKFVLDTGSDGLSQEN